MAWLDLAGGRFRLTEVADLEAAASELERLGPAELIVDEDMAATTLASDRYRTTRRPPWHFDLDSATRLLCSQFGTRDLKGFECEDFPRGIAAAGALLSYVNDTQKTALPHLDRLSVERHDDALIMDGPTRRNLELETSLTGNDSATLAGVMDRCRSPMGSRLLRRWIQRPIRDHETLAGRYQAIDAILSGGLQAEFAESLKGIGDVERILARVAIRSARPRDLRQLGAALSRLPGLKTLLGRLDSPLLAALDRQTGKHRDETKPP